MVKFFVLKFSESSGELVQLSFRGGVGEEHGRGGGGAGVQGVVAEALLLLRTHWGQQARGLSACKQFSVETFHEVTERRCCCRAGLVRSNIDPL